MLHQLIVRSRESRFPASLYPAPREKENWKYYSIVIYPSVRLNFHSAIVEMSHSGTTLWSILTGQIEKIEGNNVVTSIVLWRLCLKTCELRNTMRKRKGNRRHLSRDSLLRLCSFLYCNKVNENSIIIQFNFYIIYSKWRYEVIRSLQNSIFNHALKLKKKKKLVHWYFQKLQRTQTSKI